MSRYRDDYLKSEDWKNLRLAILIYQDYICECCGGEATDVHHLIYRNIWDVTHFDLMALCRSCHNAVHEWLKTTSAEVKRYKGKKSGLAIKQAIATHVSPRGFVCFRCSFGNGKNPRPHRVTFYSKNQKEKRNFSVLE